MKKIFALAVIAFAFAANTFAQYDRVYVSYAPTKMSASYGGVSVSSENIHGVEAGYLHGIGLSSSMPLYVETGLNMQYDSKSKDGATVSFLNMKLPVNLTYKAPVGSNMAIAPYAGLNAKYNIIGEVEYNGEKASYFKDGADANRFQVGYQVGVNFYISDVYVGAGYQGDVTKFGGDVRFNGFVATLGYSF